MSYYTQQHEFYCGVDLHAESMYFCVVDSSGNVVLHENLKTRAERFLRALEPYLEGSSAELVG